MVGLALRFGAEGLPLKRSLYQVTLTLSPETMKAVQSLSHTSRTMSEWSGKGHAPGGAM